MPKTKTTKSSSPARKQRTDPRRCCENGYFGDGHVCMKQPGPSGNSGPNTAYPNLRPWQPGQSGNPSGRPKKKPITDQLVALLDEVDGKKKKKLARLIAEMLVKRAIKGDVKAASLIADRLEGKPTQDVNVEGVNPITVVVDL